MNIKPLLDYQETDKKLYDLENELRNSDQAKEYFSVSKLLGAAQSELLSYENKAKELINGFDKTQNNMNNCEKELAEIEANLNGMNKEDFSEINFYHKKTEKLLAVFDSFEKEGKKYKKELAEIKEGIQKTLKQGQMLNEKMKSAKAAYDELKKSITPKANELMQELEKMEKNVDARALAVYKKLRKDRKLPAVVKYSDGRCIRCGMDIANDMKNKLQSSGDCIECPNCGRIVYVE